MLYKSIDDITEDDLQALVNEGRREDVQLEFKLALPGGSDEEKKEFLKDVSAMANSQGGDIIYGIRENKTTQDDAGKAAEVVAITGAGIDATKLRMFELLNSSIEPRVNGVAIRDVPVKSGFVLVVRVPRSWNSPHVVRHRNHWRFYARNSAGVYAMNVGEVRDAFAFSDTLAERLDVFRDGRLKEIVSSYPNVSNADWSTNTPSTGRERQSLLVIHLQPLDSTRSAHQIEITRALEIDRDALRLCNDNYGDPSVRLNFDGIRVTDGDNYLQIYRSGVTEEVNTSELGSDLDENRFDAECIGATELDRALFKAVGRRLALLKHFGITSPVLVSIALLGVKGCKLFIRRLFYVGDSPGGINPMLSSHAIDRANLFLTGLLIENLQDLSLSKSEDEPTGWQSVPALLRPYCDAVWNAVGYRRSEYFTPAHRWLSRVYREDRDA